MSSGLSNSPATFIDLMNRVFKNYLDSFVIVFMDDILVYSKSEDGPVSQLRIVLQLLKKNKLFAKYCKCELSKIAGFSWSHCIWYGY